MMGSEIGKGGSDVVVGKMFPRDQSVGLDKRSEMGQYRVTPVFLSASACAELALHE